MKILISSVLKKYINLGVIVHTMTLKLTRPDKIGTSFDQFAVTAFG
ncbi:MAG: hypothetical protein QME25_04980 [Bacteroidota bacterium]|nr:hypothetical protein [Bacteroidota bacterium]